MHHSIRIGFAALVLTLASACAAMPDDDIALENIGGEDTASASSALTECLAVDVTKNYKGTISGGRGDDRYPMNGKTITRVEFTPEVRCNDWLCIAGHGDASITKQDSEAVVVHWWYDLFTHLSYTLKVWVQC